MTKTLILPLLFGALGLGACFNGSPDGPSGEYGYGDDYYGDEGYGNEGAYGPNAYTQRGGGGLAGDPGATVGANGAPVQIMDVGLGVVSRVYTVLPQGYTVRGQQTTDPSKGFGGDTHIELSGPNGRKLIETAQVTFYGGEQGMYAAVERSVAQGLQRAGEQGQRSGSWEAMPASLPNMRAAKASFRAADGRTGEVRINYAIEGGAGMAFPSVYFHRAGEKDAFAADLSRINGGMRSGEQWSARQRGAGERGLADLREGHRQRMGALQDNFDAGQRAHATRQAGFDRANAAWMDNFRNSGSSSGGYGSGGGSDRGHNAFIDAMTETERYHDPSTGYERRLDAGYDRTFTNGQGEFRQTNDPFADPNAWQGDWTEQRPVDY